MARAPFRIGLTGGIGSGKSTVARSLAASGATVVDADAISRELTAAGGAAIAPVAAQFGAHAIGGDGAMDRDVIRHLVFSDPAARQRLEAIVHPLVGRRIAELSAAATASGARCLVFDIPLLVESPRWRPALDQVLVIDCREATQAARVMARSGWSREAVDAVIASQATRQQRLAAADLVLYNDEIPLEALHRSVCQLAGRFGL